jgi:hypothetical protein
MVIAKVGTSERNIYAMQNIQAKTVMVVDAK